MNMHRYLNSKIHSTLETLGWMIQKGLLLLRFSVFLFVLFFACRYGMELYYPKIGTGLDTVFGVGLESEVLEPYLEAPELLLDDDQQQRVLAAQNRYDLFLIGQSLKVGLDLIRMGHGSRQILKVDDTEIHWLKAIDFIENPHRIWCVQRALESFIKIFWEALIMSLIVSCIFLWIIKKIDALIAQAIGEDL